MNRDCIVLLLGSVLLVVGIFAACGSPAERTAQRHFNHGVDLADEGQYEQATTEFSKAIELDPYYTEAYNNRGTAYHYLGEYQQAIADYSKAIELDPSYPAPYYNRAYIYRIQGKKAEAIADFEKFITISADSYLIEMARQYIEELAE